MISNTLSPIKKSKQACPCCLEHLLITNDNFKTDDLMYHHCVNCGYEFFDTEQIRKSRERESNRPGDDQPWNMGFILLVAMAVTLMIITLSDQDARREIEPVNPERLTHVGGQLST